MPNISFQVLRCALEKAINRMRPYMKPEDHILIQDNAPTHTAASTQLEIDVIGFQRLENAPYSPGLAPMDSEVFPSFKRQ